MESQTFIRRIFPYTKGRKNSRNRWLTVSGIRSSFLYRPLAVAMVILMLPCISYLEYAGMRTGGSPFQASGQVIG